MPRAVKGVLVECDPSIKALIINLDSKNHNVVLADLDDEHLVIEERMVEHVKRELDSQLAENTFKPAELDDIQRK
ncbi:TFIIH subunit TTDA/Tfb5 [Lipomyces doorenjongii]|uniref:TFIIH subunit TTDA/Tfb5 n=1 Tax=Lipomyces doorenjongii TaxID=383834 RepID=UPI003343A259